MASTINVEPVTNGESSEKGGYTLADLKAHGTADDMYMLIDDKVYDITKFMDEVSVHYDFDLGGDQC
jgi:cytochrome b involved in lipid metabolism